MLDYIDYTCTENRMDDDVHEVPVVEDLVVLLLRVHGHVQGHRLVLPHNGAAD